MGSLVNQNVDEQWVKRRFPRRRFVHHIGVLYAGQYSIYKSVDIGEGGLLIDLDFEPLVDSKMVVTFLIPGQGYIAIQALVRYATPQEHGSHVGIEFLNIEFSSRRAIRSYVASRT